MEKKLSRDHMTTQDVVNYTGFSHSKVYSLVNKGKLQVWHPGHYKNSKCFNRKDVDAYINKTQESSND